MNPIAAAVFPPSMPKQDAGHPLSLAERVLAQGRAGNPAAAVPDAAEEEGGVTPLPEPIPEVMPELVRSWARQMFTELMMTGDEEETGITPLSIDI